MHLFCAHGRRQIRHATLAVASLALLFCAEPLALRAQGVDCEGLRSQIARGGGGGNARAAQKQSAEIARTKAFAHQLGCDSSGFLFFGGGGNDPRCPGINARIGQMEANLGRLQGGGGDPLVQRYNAYCRGGQEAPRSKGFFESLFGGGSNEQAPPPGLADAPPGENPEGEGSGAHGGGQAVCVRTCDGGFFPMAMSSHHDHGSLTEMCSALCPGTETAVYTRSPGSEIKTAMGLDGRPYMDLPNALKFQKAFSPTCTCQPAGKSWAETLANAEQILGNQRKGDILVTQEKSDELSRPKLDPKARAALLNAPGTAKMSAEDASKLAAEPGALRQTTEVVGPDGVKRQVRRVGPQD